MAFNISNFFFFLDDFTRQFSKHFLDQIPLYNQTFLDWTKFLRAKSGEEFFRV